ncbi:MAG: hypothetical protein NZO58_00725 [Gemmataceae bacterium]|nr:hypothetical protein [Gemmataceae bacterium]
MAVEELERRDLMNVGPVIGSLLFDNPSPHTTDTLQVQVVDTHAGPLTFQYDWRVNGQLVQTTTTSSTTATLDLSQPGFGDCGNVIEVTVTASDGLLLSASNGVGAYTFSWDNGVLTGVTNPFGVTLTFGYDTDGRRTSVADSFGGLITSTYTDGLLASRTLTAGALNLRVDLAYDSDNRLSQISRFAGPLQELVSQTDYAFAQGLLASITHRGAGGVILDQFLYQFDEDGFLSQITSDFTGDTDYSYDSDGQLTGESSQLVSSTFSYDANGNRVGGGYVVGPGNRLLADGTWSYSYDAEGNLVGKTHLVSGDSWTYSYDHRNQMTLAEKRDATGAVVLYAVYKYDVFGNRIEKAVDWDGDGPNVPVVTRYVLDGWTNMKPTPVGNENFDIYAELDGTNQLLARYLHGDEFDQTFARIEVNGAGSVSDGVLWYLTDHLNSVRLVLDESGVVLDQIAYNAFGAIVAQANPLFDNSILFASREFDAETGLYDNRARYLDPFTGRWTTQDPLGFLAGDANLYRYVGNMATMATDPSGLIQLPRDQWPGWVRRMVGSPDPYAPNSGNTVDRVLRVYYDRNHPGGAHYDVQYELSNGRIRNERFWRDGTPLTPSENRALNAGRRPRRGTVDVRSAVAIGITSVILSSVELVYDYYVGRGSEVALHRGSALLIGRYVRTILHNGELPEVYTPHGLVRERYFCVQLHDGRTIRVFLEPLRNSSGYGIRLVHNGELLLHQDDCPLSGW